MVNKQWPQDHSSTNVAQIYVVTLFHHHDCSLAVWLVRDGSTTFTSYILHVSAEMVPDYSKQVI